MANTTQSMLPLYIAAFSAFSGFVGSWLGAQIALLNFKRQRAFDKQLDWYERIDKAIQELIESIEIAGTYEDESKAGVKVRSDAWTAVQLAHLEVGRISEQAALYGSAKATKMAEKIERLVQDVADKTEAFDPPLIAANKKDAVLEEIWALPSRLRSARRALITEARHHLGLEKKRIVSFEGFMPRGTKSR